MAVLARYPVSRTLRDSVHKCKRNSWSFAGSTVLIMSGSYRRMGIRLLIEWSQVRVPARGARFFNYLDIVR